MFGTLLLAMLIVQAPSAAPPTGMPQAPATAPQATAEKPWPPEGVFRIRDVKPPRLIKEVAPSYTGDAMRAKIQGVVLLEAIVERGRKGQRGAGKAVARS